MLGCGFVTGVAAFSVLRHSGMSHCCDALPGASRNAASAGLLKGIIRRTARQAGHFSAVAQRRGLRGERMLSRHSSHG